MSDSNASERESVGWPGVSDASDAFEAGEDDAKRHAADAPRGGRTPTKKGGSRMRGHAAAGAAEERAEGRGALLDSISPSLPSDPQDHDPHAGEEPAEPFECAFAGIVHRAMWPTVEGSIASGLSLVGLTLTTAHADIILPDGARFIQEACQHEGEGILLARDIGPRHGQDHFHGPALTRDPTALCERWCEISGALLRHIKRSVAGGWPESVYRAYGHFGIVLAYAFKPWPAEHGRRSLTRDVLASGVFSAPWMAARAILLGSLPSLATEPGKASAKGRNCQRCGRPMPARKRAHARWCSKRCKGAAYEDRHPGRKFGPPRTSGGSPDDSE